MRLALTAEFGAALGNVVPAENLIRPFQAAC